jgi:drug/metabolite transporter (DMT)-like permease
MYYITIIVAIFSSAAYHIVQKATPVQVNPILTLIGTYIIAIAICIGLFPFFPLKMDFPSEIKQLNWTSIGLAISIVGLEVGYILAYRAGWNVSFGAVVANVAVALLLIPVGLIFFKEKIAPVNYVGIIICILGLIMVNWKPS